MKHPFFCLSLVTLSLAACGEQASIPEACAKLAECEEQATQSECEQKFEEDRNAFEAAGCADEFDDYVACTAGVENICSQEAVQTECAQDVLDLLQCGGVI